MGKMWTKMMNHGILGYPVFGLHLASFPYHSHQKPPKSTHAIEKTSCHLVGLLTYWLMIKNGNAHIFSSTWSGFHLHPAVLCFQLEFTALVAGWGGPIYHPSSYLSVDLRLSNCSNYSNPQKEFIKIDK